MPTSSGYCRPFIERKKNYIIGVYKTLNSQPNYT